MSGQATYIGMLRQIDMRCCHACTRWEDDEDFEEWRGVKMEMGRLTELCASQTLEAIVLTVL